MTIPTRYTEADKNRVAAWFLANPDARPRVCAEAFQFNVAFAKRIRCELVEAGQLLLLPPGPTKTTAAERARIADGIGKAKKRDVEAALRQRLKDSQHRISIFEDRLADLDRANKELAQMLVIAEKKIEILGRQR